MSANPVYFPQIPELDQTRLVPMQECHLDAVMQLEQENYPFPWTYGNFVDSLRSGYQARVLRSAAGEMLGYFLMMYAVDEAHLLNITVAASLHGKGIGRWLLDQARSEAKERGMRSMLLEVRPSNQRALHVYQRYGFVQIGLRRQYYPAANNSREDAIVMRLAW
jgi:ribosomal-protein-alanine N-acetyltransferase